MMRKTGKLFLIFGMIICIIFATGCGGGSSKPKDPLYCKFEFQDIYDIDDIYAVNLSYGHDFDIGDDDVNHINSTIALVKIITIEHKNQYYDFEDKLAGETLLYIDGFLSPKYRVTEYKWNCQGFRYNNFATVEIPKKLIQGESGFLVLSFNLCFLDENDEISLNSGSSVVLKLSYSIKDDKIYFERI